MRSSVRHRSTGRGGFSVVELLVAVAAGAGVLAAGYAMMSSMSQRVQALENRRGIYSIRSRIMQSVSCAKTLRTDASGAFTGFLNGPGELRNANDQPVLKSLVTSPSAGIFRDKYLVEGPWYADVVFGGGGAGIIIRLARKSPSGWTAAFSPPGPDQLPSGTRRDDFSAPFNPVIGSSGDVFQLCAKPRESGLQLAQFAISFADFVARTGFSPTIASTEGCLASAKYPMLMIESCVIYCKQQDFTSGWQAECADANIYVDGSGHVVVDHIANPLDQKVGCSCVR